VTGRNLLAVTTILFAFGAFAVRSLVSIVAEVSSAPTFHTLDPRATTNLFLQVLDARQAGALLETAINAYPPGGPLLFITTAKEPAAVQVYYTVSYLAYPRPVSAVICGSTEFPTIERFSPSSEIDGLIFFALTPSGNTPAERVTPRLLMSPHHGPALWQSFCR